MLTHAEAILILQQVDETFVYDNEKDLRAVLTAFTVGATAGVQILATIQALLINSGFEEAHANSYALAALSAVGKCYVDNRDTAIGEGVEGTAYDQEVLDRMQDTYVEYNQRCIAAVNDKAADATSNIIHGIFGKQSDPTAPH